MKTIDLLSKTARTLRRPSVVLITVGLLLLCSFVFIQLRRLEYAATFNPSGYVSGPAWTPPSNGEDVWFKSINGERAHGWFLRAALQPALATVLYCHGNSGNITDVRLVGDKFTQRNLNVLIFDYRGYGRSEGKPTDEWGLYADTEAARDYLIRERGVDTSRLVLYGQSLGAAVAINNAARQPCKALIVESGFSSASDMGVVNFPWLPRWLHSLAKNRFDSAGKMANVKCPVLIIHGTDDPVVPVEQGRSLFNAARDPKRLVIIPEGRHDLLAVGGDVFVDQVLNFIREVRPGE